MSVDVEDALIERVMRRYGLPTKRAAIDLALRRLDVEPLNQEEALAMRGSGWGADLDELPNVGRCGDLLKYFSV
jgi:Arc/MetJ family transcription regulator